MQQLNEETKQFLLDAIRTIPGFPKEGIMFKDITTLLNNGEAFKMLIDHLVKRYETMDLDYIAGIDSRGFIFGAPLATRLGIGFVPVRKKGKLPHTTFEEEYELEYGTDKIEIHIDAFHEKQGAKVLLIDDLMATGGTAVAAANLINKTGAQCVESCFIMNLNFPEAQEKLGAISPIYTVID
jgi:adenine phosphoribosyltransferase